jgi:hypothetical protein
MEFRISNGVEVPDGLRGKLVEISDAALARDDEHLNGTVDGRPVFVSREWLRDPDLPLPPLSVSVEPADDPEPRWLDFARNAFWFVCGFAAGAVSVHQGWLP